MNAREPRGYAQSDHVPLAENWYTEGKTRVTLGARTGLVVERYMPRVKARYRDKQRQNPRAVPRDNERRERLTGKGCLHELTGKRETRAQARERKARLNPVKRIWREPVPVAPSSPLTKRKRAKRTRLTSTAERLAFQVRERKRAHVRKAREIRDAQRKEWREIQTAMFPSIQVPLRDFRAVRWQG